MAQMTRSMAENIIKDADLYKHYPLTVWEQRQLAYAWLKLHAPDSPMLNVKPFAAMEKKRNERVP